MAVLQSFILGIIEGATEFLPVSSTGHLILASSLFGISQSEFTKVFEISIQLGAILAVAVLYWRTILNFGLIKKIIAAFIPTGVIGLALYPFIKTYLLGNDYIVLASLFAGGIALIAFEKWHTDAPEEETPSDLTYRQAFLIGFFQAIAIIPGISRSGATIVGGLLLGITRPVIVEFSFLLAVPTMVAATGLSLLSVQTSFTRPEWIALLVGGTTSFVVALVVIRWFLAYVRSHSFTSFGIYRIVLSLLFAAFLFL